MGIGGILEPMILTKQRVSSRLSKEAIKPYIGGVLKRSGSAATLNNSKKKLNFNKTTNSIIYALQDLRESQIAKERRLSQSVTRDRKRT